MPGAMHGAASGLSYLEYKIIPFSRRNAKSVRGAGTNAAPRHAPLENKLFIFKCVDYMPEKTPETLRAFVKELSVFLLRNFVKNGILLNIWRGNRIPESGSPPP